WVLWRLLRWSLHRRDGSGRLRWLIGWPLRLLVGRSLHRRGWSGRLVDGPLLLRLRRSSGRCRQISAAECAVRSIVAVYCSAKGAAHSLSLHVFLHRYSCFVSISCAGDKSYISL